jgi:hypothetical protein
MAFTENRINLDFFGMFSAPSICDKHPETFCITVHMKEPVNSEVLQQASDDLFRRLPFLSGRLNSDKRGFYYETIQEFPKIALEKKPHNFNMFYKTGKGYLLRVLYAERHIKIETAHFVIDGRGLSKIANALIVRYFELLGVSADKTNFIDCDDVFKAEEMEDAVLRFADTYNPHKPKVKEPKIAYKSGHKKSAATWTASRQFDLDVIKSKAKSYGLSITGYLALSIFKALEEERNAIGNKKPIVATLPIDCRSFFPTQTLRNFAYSKNIIMPESTSYEQMAQQVKSQLTEIDSDYIQEALNDLKMAMDAFQKIPFKLRNFIIKWVKRSQFKKVTFVLSSLGLAELPKEITERIDMLEFLCSPEVYHPYTFSCISFGNTLTLSVSAVTTDKKTVEKIFEQIAAT